MSNIEKAEFSADRLFQFEENLRSIFDAFYKPNDLKVVKKRLQSSDGIDMHSDMHAEIDLDSGQIHASSGSTVQRLRVYIDRLKSIEDYSGEILPYLDDEGRFAR